MKKERKMVLCAPVVLIALMTVGSLVLLGCDTDVSSPDNPDVLPASNPQSVTTGVSLALESIVEVRIDIKPGSDPNSINLGSKGNIPVAIFSAADFDARTVDPITVALEGAGVKVKGNGTPMSSFKDFDGDGRLDIVVHVYTENLELETGDAEASLTGTTFDAVEFMGTDSVKIVP
jgi:hypothetical protein